MSKKLLVIALAVGAALRIAASESKPDTSLGETHYFLTASGGLVEQLDHLQKGESPYATWVDATEWQDYLRPSDRWAFSEIGHGHGLYDVHPPLTSWLLNIWGRLFGVSLTVGRALMNLMSLLTILALYGLVKEAVDEDTAGWTALFYSLSSVIVQTQSEVRHYTVVALAVTLFAWAVYRCTDPNRPLTITRGLSLMLATAFGALTFHLFTILAVTGAGAYAVVRVWPNKKRILQLGGWVAASYVLFALLFPDWYLNFTYAQGLTTGRSFLGLAVRATRYFVSLLHFFVPEDTWRPISDLMFPDTIPWVLKLGLPVLLTVGGLVWGIAWLRRSKNINFGRSLLEAYRDNPGTVFLLWMFFCTGVVHLLLFLGFVLQESAMGGKYLSLSWPFFACIPALLLKGRRPALVALSVAMFLSTSFGLWHRNQVGILRTRFAYEQVIAKADRLVIGSVFREELYAVMWYAKPKAKVYAATQADLIKRQAEWLPQVEGDHTVFVGYGQEINGAGFITRVDANVDPAFQDAELKTLREIFESKFRMEYYDGNRQELRNVFRVQTGTTAAAR